jgi:catecholate siderophore receptor
MSVRSIRRDRLARTGLGAAGAFAATAGTLPALAADRTADQGEGGANVVVTARRLGIAALSEKVQNTPQSINVLPRQLLQEQQITTLQEALKNVPGVTLNSGEGGSHGDSINLRGFPASDDFFLDGLRDTGFYTRDPFDDETIEILKGPASTLFGRGSTGGVINQVSKTPKLGDFIAGTITGGGDDEVRGTADANYAFSDDSAFRVNLMGQRSNVEDRDFVLNKRWAVAPSLALGIGGPNTLTLNYLHQNQDDIPDYGIPFVIAQKAAPGIPFVPGRPAPVDRSNFYGLVDDDRFRTDVDIGTLKFTHQFSDDLSISESARVGNYYFDSRETAAHYDPSGLIPPATATTPLGGVFTYRDRPSVDGTVATLMSETALTWRVTTGPLQHTLIFGFDADQESAELIRFTNPLTSIAPTPILHPNPFEPNPGHQAVVRQAPDTKTDTLAGFVSDSIDFGPHWNVVAGIRYDQFHADFTQPLGTATHFTHTDDVPSPRVALVYKPLETLSFYASYGTSFDPSAENLSLAASNADLAPEKDQTFEGGAKAVVLNGRLSLTAAVFQTEMTNARFADPTNPTLQQLAGDLRVRGVEFGVQGHLTDRWEILAGYTHLDATTVKSTDPRQVGKALQNTAPNAANVWTTYELTDALTLGTGLNYLDKRPADVYATAFVPSYVTWDAMASYRLDKHITVQVNATNLTDVLYFTNSYYSSDAENHVVPGPGRTVTATLAFRY